MVSAVDIVTYVGIPLAVLGVLPTIYTCLKSFLTLREIQRTLSRNGVTAITRSALLSGIVEIEIPRRSLQPLERGDPGYFGTRPDGENESQTYVKEAESVGLIGKRSDLKGGTWTLFYWKEMVIGVKSYRLQYHDELTQPQAEIDFEKLVAFLLDRGAVPDKQGFSDLRGSGLWTPAGTKLLLSPCTNDAVLMVSTSEDSDGILSLSLHWRSEWDRRGIDSLPPYWTRLNPPPADEDVLSFLENQQDASKKEKKEDFLDDDSTPNTEVNSLHSTHTTPIRIRLGNTGLEEAYRETDQKHRLNLPHLQSTPPTTTTDSPGFWFSCAATALGAPQGGLWSFAIPDDILSVSRRETVPCAVMVLLGVMTDDEVPTWRTPYDDQAEQFERHVKFVESARKMNEEMRLPPAEREAARRRRIDQEAFDFHNDSRRRLMKEDQRKEKEITEAMNSQKLGISVVAEANRKWLVSNKFIKEETTIAAVVEQVLFGMVKDEAFARRVVMMLDLWKSWSQSGGMTKSHFLAIKEDQASFKLASFVLCVIKSTVAEPRGSVVSDLQECLRMWKRVRLG